MAYWWRVLVIGNLNKDPRYIRDSSSPSLSRNLCFVVLIKDGGLGEDEAVYPLCTVTNKNLYIKNLMRVSNNSNYKFKLEMY